MSDKYNKEEPSVIQKIQNQTGCLLLVIGIAMLAFVLTDLLSSRTSLFGGNANSIGTINGESVDVQEYNALYEKIVANLQAQNPGLNLSEQFLESYKQQAWNQLVQQKLVSLEYADAGIDVSGEEMEDITIGDHTHEQLLTAFKNPETNQFDKSRLVRFLTEDIEANPEQKSAWLEFEKQLIAQLKGEKYSALVQRMFYATELEAVGDMKEHQQGLSANLVGVSFATIPDSSITVTDADLKSYIKAHSFQFKQEASRDIEFVVFDLKPSKEDTIATRQWVADNIEKFKNATDDSLFVAYSGSETPFDPGFKVRGNFTADVEDDLFSADTGTVLGPYENQGVFALFKIVAIGEDSLKSVRASHILLPVNGRTKEDTLKAMDEAKALLSDIRSGKTSFETEARNKNYDGSGQKGGDLGWLREGSTSVPKKFLDRALTAGDGNYFIVSTNSGVHIGKTTSGISSKTIKVARLTQTVEPSTETDKEYYRMAGEFLAKAKGNEASFEDIAEEMGYSKKISKKITEDLRRVAGINNGNIVARWLFDDDTEEGDVSDIIEVDGKYVIAHCTKIREKGIAEVDDVRDEIEMVVRNQMKAEGIVKQFKEAMKSADNAEALAKALETVVTPIPNVLYSEGSLPYIGHDDKVVGALFGTEAGKHTDVIIGDQGVYVAWVNGYNEFKMPEDIDYVKANYNGVLNEGIDSKIERSLLEIGKVKDRRYKFY